MELFCIKTVICAAGNPDIRHDVLPTDIFDALALRLLETRDDFKVAEASENTMVESLR